MAHLSITCQLIDTYGISVCNMSALRYQWYNICLLHVSSYISMVQHQSMKCQQINIYDKFVFDMSAHIYPWYNTCLRHVYLFPWAFIRNNSVCSNTKEPKQVQHMDIRVQLLSLSLAFSQGSRTFFEHFSNKFRSNCRT